MARGQKNMRDSEKELLFKVKPLLRAAGIAPW
jgi:hypothetical protein